MNRGFLAGFLSFIMVLNINSRDFKRKSLRQNRESEMRSQNNQSTYTILPPSNKSHVTSTKG